jgi:OOP family OmpA-OmpF porin
MFDSAGRKILFGVVTGTLLSSAVASVLAADERETHNLIDSEGRAVLTSRQEECVQTPNTPNTPPKLFKECGNIGDRDGDGIPDDEDMCPDNTPEEISKGVYQDGPKKGCPIDTDNDGVPDYRDDCPNNTPLEISKGVDDRGCPLDSDGDGVPDYRDKCPGTPPGVEVNEDGCPTECVPETDPNKCLPVIFSSEALFDFDKFNLRPDGQRALDEFLSHKEIELVYSINVIGHTDPTGTDSYNMTLSNKRAATVANYLKSRLPATVQIFSEGRGETQLVPRDLANNESQSAWHQRCRRVEVKVREYKRKQQ